MTELTSIGLFNRQKNHVGISEKGLVVDEERQESHEQQSDRNWHEVLQELRVMQTGTQILPRTL